jgi:hypothetical protein
MERPLAAREVKTAVSEIGNAPRSNRGAVWRLTGYAHDTVITDEKFPACNTDETAIVALMRERLAAHLAPEELQQVVPTKAVKDGKSLAIRMGTSTRYVATLLDSKS